MKWLTRKGANRVDDERTDTLPPTKTQLPATPTMYLPLQKYLSDRYADTVVLRLAEIEDLLGVALPDLARLNPAWWANPTAGSAASAQSRSWTHANRTAKPNLVAGTIIFERVVA